MQTTKMELVSPEMFKTQSQVEFHMLLFFIRTENQ